MGTQTKIVEKIIKKQANYVLAVKKKQALLYKEIAEYLSDKYYIEEIKKIRQLQKDCRNKPWSDRNS